MELYIILYGIFVIFIASMIQGLVGFGFAMVAVPLLIQYSPSILIIPTILILSIVINLFIIIDARKYLEIKRILPLMVSSGIGTPVGIKLLTIISEDFIKILAGIIITLYSFAMFFGYKSYINNEKLACLPIGFISGILNGSTAMSGPPVILFYNNQGIKKEIFRANLVLYFLFLGLYAIIVMLISKMINFKIIQNTLYFIIPLIVGVTTGILLSKKINESLFKKITISILVIFGIITVISGLH